MSEHKPISTSEQILRRRKELLAAEASQPAPDADQGKWNRFYGGQDGNVVTPIGARAVRSGEVSIEQTGHTPDTHALENPGVDSSAAWDQFVRMPGGELAADIQNDRNKGFGEEPQASSTPDTPQNVVPLQPRHPN